MEELRKIFSDNLKLLRGNKSQQQFAMELGLKSQATYKNYEDGRVPKAKILQQIGLALGIKPSQLLEPLKTPPNGKVIRCDFSEVASVGSAAAGRGRTFEDVEYEEKILAEELKDPNAIAIEISGDSMEPDFKNGQRVVFDTKNDPVPGKPVVVKDADDNVYFKLYFPVDDGFILRSINTRYPDIKISKSGFKWIYKAHGMYVRF